jgi:hypothetical protein
MRTRLLFIFLLLLATLSVCKKTDSPVTSGTVTLRSTLYGTGPYYANGFSFSLAKEISTISNPGPDITVNISKNLDGTIKEVSFEASNYENSFSLIGSYETETSAIQTFTDLLTFGYVQWIARAIPVKNNQIWLFRSGTGKYVKLRIITLEEKIIQDQLSAECTFEWVYQPDGTTTFPVR